MEVIAELLGSENGSRYRGVSQLCAKVYVPILARFTSEAPTAKTYSMSLLLDGSSLGGLLGAR